MPGVFAVDHQIARRKALFKKAFLNRQERHENSDRAGQACGDQEVLPRLNAAAVCEWTHYLVVVGAVPRAASALALIDEAGAVGAVGGTAANEPVAPPLARNAAVALAKR